MKPILSPAVGRRKTLVDSRTPPALIVALSLSLSPGGHAQEAAGGPASTGPKATAPASAAPSSEQPKPASGPTGLDVYVLVKKLSRINARAATAFTPSQAQELSDLLVPLFEQPELDPRDTRVLIADVRRSLSHAQTAALDAIQDLTPQSVMPLVPPGPPAAPEPFGPPPGPPGGPPVDPTRSPRFNPFYPTPGAALTEQATRDLRELLDALGRVAPPATARPARLSLRPSRKISVTTFHYNLARTGWNAKERILTPRNVNRDRFGRWWHTLLDGQVYAAPLVVADVQLGGKTRDIVIAPTENNSVYALDACPAPRPCRTRGRERYPPWGRWRGGRAISPPPAPLSTRASRSGENWATRWASPQP